MGKWLLGLLCGLLLAGCATPAPPLVVTHYDGQDGGLQFLIEPVDADVYVDGVHKGKVADFQGDGVLLLERGLHAVEVSRDGYHTLFRQMQASHGLLEILVYTLTVNAE